jgi:hypothetical protein
LALAFAPQQYSSMASELAPPSPRPPSPPTPIEEDLSGAHQWSDDENKLLDPSSKAKGKARQLYDDAADSQDYPPVNDDEAETRRIEEVPLAPSSFVSYTDFPRPAESQTMGGRGAHEAESSSRVDDARLGADTVSPSGRWPTREFVVAGQEVAESKHAGDA